MAATIRPGLSGALALRAARAIRENICPQSRRTGGGLIHPNWKKIASGFAAIVAVAAAGVGFWVYDSLNTGRSSVADDRVALADFKSTDRNAIKRGEYVMRTGDCMACHTEHGKSPFAGGL